MDAATRYEYLQLITQAQELFIQTDDASRTMNSLLNELMRFSNSHYGFLAELKNLDNLSQSINFLAIANTNDPEKSTFYRDYLPDPIPLKNKHQLFEQAITEEKPQLCSSFSACSDIKNLPALPNTFEQILIIPICGFSNTIGFICLAREESQYSLELIDLIETHNNSIAHLLYAIRLSKQHLVVKTKLEDTDLQLRSSQQAAKVGSWEYCFENKQSQWSEQVFHIYGYQPEEVKANIDNELEKIIPEDKALFENAFSEALSGANLDLYYRITSSKGSSKTLHNIASIVRDKDGRAIKLAGIIHDISEQVNAELKLIVSESKFRAIVENINAPIVSLNKHGRILIFNKAAESCFDYKQGELNGSTTKALFSKDENEVELQQLIRLATKKSTSEGQNTYELTGKRKNGQSFPINISLSSLPKHTVKSNTDTAFIILIKDLTELKISEKVMQQSNTMEALGHIAGGISHDFNNILNIISGNLEIMQMKYSDDEGLVKRIGSALKGVTRGHQLTEKLSRLARFENTQNQPVHLTQTVRYISDLLTEAISASIKLNFNLEEELDLISLDAGNLTDSLINLCINASDAMPDGGEISIATRNISQNTKNIEQKHRDALSDSDYVQLVVEDNGEGIPQDIVDRIFEPFFTTKAKNKGTGLGLSMIFNFVKNSQGHIFVNSELNQGTQFTIYFPIDEKQKEADNKHLEHRDKGFDFSNKKILIVDDEPSILSLLGAFLEQYGLAITTSLSADDALLILAEQPFDLILSDILMPGNIDGIEFAEKIRISYEDTPIILMSSYTDRMLANRPNLEHFSLITKPFKKKELLSQMHKALQ